MRSWAGRRAWQGVHHPEAKHSPRSPRRATSLPFPAAQLQKSWHFHLGSTAANAEQAGLFVPSA